MRVARNCLLLWLLAGACGAWGADVGFSSGINLSAVAEKPDQANQQSATTAPSATDRWWQTADGPGLRLTYVGEFANEPDGQPAIALLFTGKFGTDGNFNQYLSVRHPDGTLVKGHWQRSASPQLLYFNVPSAAKYIVQVQQGLSDRDSRHLLETLSGPVVVGKPEQNEH